MYSRSISRSYLPPSVFALILLAGITTPSAANDHGRTLHVANNGADSAICGSKMNPCRSISRAIFIAQEGDRILVGPGRYGDLDIDGIGGEPGEELAEVGSGCQCMLHVNKRVTILSTAGPTATVVDAQMFVNFVHGVVVDASGAVFGSPGHGFTATNADRGGGLNVFGAATTGVRLEGNISSGNADGFNIFGIGNIIKNNLAVGNGGTGFFFRGKGHVVRSNSSLGGGRGFFVDADEVVLKNNISNGNSVGYYLARNARLIRNAAIGNSDSGIHVGPGATGAVRRNNIVGNGNSETTANCGLINESGQQLTATLNFWGAASGPGIDPADQICDVDGSSTLFEPSAELPFQVDGPNLIEERDDQ